MARRRLTHDDYRARLQAYCDRYETRPTAKGFPPFPAGRRESQQHREWIALHRLHDRLSRRERGQCQRCSELVTEGGLYCVAHGPAVGGGLQPAERDALLAEQNGLCPVCEKRLTLPAARLHSRPGRTAEGASTGALLHPECSRLVSLVEAAGPCALARIQQFLTTGPAGRTHRNA